MKVINISIMMLLYVFFMLYGIESYKDTEYNIDLINKEENKIVNAQELSASINNKKTDKSSSIFNNSHSLFSIEKEWIIYPSRSKDDFFELIKYNLESKEKVVLSDDYAGSVTTDNNWIYFTSIKNSYYDNSINLYKGESGINKIKSDGSRKILIYNGKVRLISAKDNWIYFIKKINNNENNIYRVSSDGEIVEKLIADVNTFLNPIINDNYIYYTKNSSNDVSKTNNIIYVYNVLNKSSEELFRLNNHVEDSDIDNFVVYDDLVVLNIKNTDSNYDIYQYNCNTDNFDKISKSNDMMISMTLFDDRYIIYTIPAGYELNSPYKNLLYNLCVYDKVTGEIKVISSDVYLGFFGHIDSYIFYNTMENACVYNIRTGEVENLK